MTGSSWIRALKEARRPLAFFAGSIVAVGIALFGGGFDALAPLSQQAVCALGILAGCIIWWVSGVFPESVTALIMAVAFIVICGVPTEVAFSSFASSTWWLLVAAFALGLGMQRSGLMERMASAILRIFPNTFKMQAAGLMAAGTLVGPFIPSLSAKATMLAPLSLGISDSLGYERKGRQAEGLFLAMFTGLRTIGPAVISASVIGYGLVATLPSEVAARFDMLTWCVDMLPWFAFVTIVDYIAIVALYGPRGKEAPAAASAARTSERDPMTPVEKRLAAIMVCCILMWVTEPVHGVEAHVVAIMAMVLMVATGVVSMKELRSGVAWESLIFIGCVLGLASVFAHLGIDAWIVSSCQPAFVALAGDPYLLITGICIITVLLRFVIVSEMAYINIFMAFMVPLSAGLGVSPWVIGVSVYAVVNPWFALYQNPIYLTAYYATEGEMVRQSSMARYCVVYLAICIVGLLISIPYWQWLGLL